MSANLHKSLPSFYLFSLPLSGGDLDSTINLDNLDSDICRRLAGTGLCGGFLQLADGIVCALRKVAGVDLSSFGFLDQRLDRDAVELRESDGENLPRGGGSRDSALIILTLRDAALDSDSEVYVIVAGFDLCCLDSLGKSDLFDGGKILHSLTPFVVSVVWLKRSVAIIPFEHGFGLCLEALDAPVSVSVTIAIGRIDSLDIDVIKRRLTLAANCPVSSNDQ